MAAGPFRWLLREWPTMVAMAIWAVGGTVMSVATLLTPPTWWLSRLAMVLNGAIWVVLILAGTFAGVLMIYFVIRVMFL